MASARWLSNVRGLMFIRSAPCLLEQPSLISASTSRSRLVKGFWPVSDANITSAARLLSFDRAFAFPSLMRLCSRSAGRMNVGELLQHGADTLGLLKRVL